MSTESEGTRQRGCLSETWWDGVEDNMKSFGLSCEDAHNKDNWRMRIKGA